MLFEWSCEFTSVNRARLLFYQASVHELGSNTRTLPGTTPASPLYSQRKLIRYYLLGSNNFQLYTLIVLSIRYRQLLHNSEIQIMVYEPFVIRFYTVTVHYINPVSNYTA